MIKSFVALAMAVALAGAARASDEAEHHHDHLAPEKLGRVDFKTSCDPMERESFNRAVALLHSFAYGASRKEFEAVAQQDPHCAMALWGQAMTHYHQLWEPPVDSDNELRAGEDEVQRAADMPGAPARERAYIAALQEYYRDWEHTAAKVRAERYARAMADVAVHHPEDREAQVFFALALVGTAPVADRTHANQKRAADILEPLWKLEPLHPGIAHYLIHAYDSAELAPRGLPAARAYAKIAPSAPHAQHMPSHIFTRLGLWRDSVASNLAAEAAARAQGDVGEQLHAMDYLTYADLQLGRYDDAAKVVAKVRSMSGLPAAQFEVGYAANAMPVRLAVEGRDWEAAKRLTPLPGSPPKVAAIVYRARTRGDLRSASPTSPDADIDALAACGAALRGSGDDYWAAQADAMLKSAQAWRLQAAGDAGGAVASMRAAADEEDALEKLPVTPGPIVPAREQLGELLLLLHRPAQALPEFKSALAAAPGRRAALQGAIAAAEQSGDAAVVDRLRAQAAMHAR